MPTVLTCTNRRTPAFAADRARLAETPTLTDRNSSSGAPRPRWRLPRPAMVVAGHAAEAGGRLVGKEPPFSRRSLAFFENDNAFDCSAAARGLGFTPGVDFRDGIRRTLEDQAWPLAL